VSARAITLVTVVLSACATVDTHEARFVDAPYCALLAQGTRYEFHKDQGASERLTAAALDWREPRVHVASKEAVEFECLRSVQRALERAGKVVSYKMDP
jgi:hypothetical protein